MTASLTAVPPGVDPARASRLTSLAHESFVATGRPDRPVRPLVLDSWRRSSTAGVDPDTIHAPVQLADDELDAYREQHPLAGAMPVIRNLLVSDAVDSGFVVAIFDAQGRMLWVEGNRGLRSRAAEMWFVEGANWSEEYVGTNAPGLVLATQQSAQVFASEHFTRAVQPWSCTATPIVDPESQELLGVLDVSGAGDVATPRALTLVRTAAAAAESELRLRRIDGISEEPRLKVLRSGRLDVLGRPQARLWWKGRRLRLSVRHAELLLLLALHPEGMTADQLACGLHEGDRRQVTVRAEITRLRRIVSESAILSRPYRLAEPLDTDVDELRRLLAKGAHRQALALYGGPVLPRSDAPAIVALRHEVRRRLRNALLAHATLDVVLSYAQSQDGLNDTMVWQACLDRLRYGSPRRTQVRTHLDRLRESSR
jgi:transcriptional regulator of acetoin/glycerol metabolism